MLCCPKCLSYQVSGPNYSKGSDGKEQLDYRCGRCGYSESQPCADEKPKDLGDLIRSFKP